MLFKINLTDDILDHIGEISQFVKSLWSNHQAEFYLWIIIEMSFSIINTSSNFLKFYFCDDSVGVRGSILIKQLLFGHLLLY